MSSAFQRARRRFEFGFKTDDSLNDIHESKLSGSLGGGTPGNGTLSPRRPNSVSIAPSLTEYEERTGKRTPSDSFIIPKTVMNGEADEIRSWMGSSSRASTHPLPSAAPVWRSGALGGTLDRPAGLKLLPALDEHQDVHECIQDKQRVGEILSMIEKPCIYCVTVQRDLGQVTLPGGVSALEDVAFVLEYPLSEHHGVDSIKSGALTSSVPMHIAICGDKVILFRGQVSAYALGSVDEGMSFASEMHGALGRSAGEETFGSTSAVPILACHIISPTNRADRNHSSISAIPWLRGGTIYKESCHQEATRWLRLETPFLALLLRFRAPLEAEQFSKAFVTRRASARMHAKLLYCAAIRIQAAWRGCYARRLVAPHRRPVSATFTQKSQQHLKRPTMGNMTEERATLVLQSAYRGHIARRLCQRMETAYTVARQRRMNCRIEGSCLIGSRLIAKSWIRGGHVSLQWHRSTYFTFSQNSSTWEPIFGANHRVYVPSGKDLGRSLKVQWTVCSIRTGQIVDISEACTRPIDLDVAGEEAAILQGIESRPHFSMRCIQVHQHSTESVIHADAWVADAPYRLSLRSRDVTLQRVKPRARHSSDASGTTSESDTDINQEMVIPYEFIQVDTNVTPGGDCAVLAMADTRQELTIVLEAKDPAQRNVAMILMDRMRVSTAGRATDAISQTNMGRFVAAAAAAVSSVSTLHLATPKDSLGVSAMARSPTCTKSLLQLRAKGQPKKSSSVIQKLSHRFSGFRVGSKSSATKRPFLQPGLDREIDETERDKTLTPLIHRFQKRFA